ncbi:PREDICTED: nose resistant to fluoxetine protein 6-like [Eufriesea mexicana]|uniref:nose resistant to fluoxetine protein 6-like n=1 Tax=Eufriesea mexicana TaxID=516756 RepID=UPI00083C8937|nr:PREDICTED: nose resistant to fluoxetine protein 6-like [Eufriesea mexicana]
MFGERLLGLFLVFLSVSGLKLIEKTAHFYNDELKVNNDILKKNHSTSWEKHMKIKEVIQSSIAEDIVNRSILHLNDLNIWNPYMLANFWSHYDIRKSLNVSSDCEKDITNYMTALLKGDKWALKMVDATGRYTSGLFSGNVFWLGNVDQCREMRIKFIDRHSDDKSEHQEDIPPFLVSMSSITLNLSIYQTNLNETYRVIFGFCSPDSCNLEDTEKLLYFVQDQRGNDSSMKIAIETIRNLSKDIYNSDSVPRPLSEALLSFSLLLNLSKLFSLDVGADTLAPIHGLRFLSMIWIILVHTCLTVNVVSEGETFKSNVESEFMYQTISNSTYAVDTFFFMSGCLVSFLYFRTITKDNMKKKKIIRGCCGQIMQFLGMVWYRYFRLTPVYLLVIGLIEVSMSWYYNHTVLDLYMLDYHNCRKFWWRNALYINTYFSMDERCIVWSWYLANDTLFYIIGAIILIISARFVFVAGIITISILVISWITTAIITLNIGHIPSIQDPFAHYESLYDKPWSRIGPYLFGMIAGWYLYKSDCKIKIRKTIALVFWTLSFVTILSIVYGLYGNKLSPFLSAIYTALSHSGWAISIAWILIACVTGHGGIINKVLSWRGLYPLSRLTYCAYLVHPAIIRAVVLHGESSLHLTQGLMVL